MTCSGCHEVVCSARCPNYVMPKASVYCCKCGGGIYEGEEYIENYKNDTAHVDCFSDPRDLLKWLGETIYTEGDYYDDDPYEIRRV